MLQRIPMLALLLAAILLAAIACAPPAPDEAAPDEAAPDEATPDTEEPAAEESGQEEQVRWTYEGSTGPEFWGDLSPDYALCGSGQAQSPIDVVSAAEDDLGDLVFAYQPAPLTVENNGHTMEVAYAAGSTLELDGAAFGLRQFHFHTPSEHTVDGEHAPMEMHLVHEDTAKNLAVVGVLIDVGEANAAFEPVAANFPDAVGTNEVDGVTVNAADLLPDDRLAWRYKGSLTTPRCAEGVAWSVLQGRIAVSQEQIDAFQSRIGANNRPVQPLNERTVTRDTGADP